MIRNYLKMALRNIVKNKTYSVINITGLAIGLASCLVIFLAIINELNFDTFYPEAKNIYRVISESASPNGVKKDGMSPYPMAEAIRTDYPQLEKVTQVLYMPEGQINIDIRQFREEGILYADSMFYEVFNPEFIAGTVELAKNTPDGVVLSESLAEKFFGNNPPIGEIIKYDNAVELQVVGIIKDIPSNTHLPYSMIISSKSLDENMLGFNLMDWSVSISSSQTYMLLPPNLNYERVNEYLGNIGSKYLPERRKATDKFFLQPLLDIHLTPELESFNYSTSPRTLLVFALIGILILIIASINFVNLSTAQTLKRSKEVGVRKVLGAKRSQIMNQLMGEVITFTAIAVIISLLLTYLILPEVNAFFDNSMELSLFDSFSILGFLLLVFVFVCIITGLYPALVLSRFNPVEAFRSKILKSGKGSFSVRNGLVIFQFIISQVLIIGTIIISQQMDYFRNKDLGFTKEQILEIQIPQPDASKMDLFRNKLLQNPQVAGVSFGSGTPITDKRLNTAFAPNPEDPEYRIEVEIKPADENFFEVFDIKLLAGNLYGKYTPGDTLFGYVINESLSKKLGVENPEESIGKPIAFHAWPGRVIGVVEDFHTASLHSSINPVMLLNFLPRYFFGASVKLSSNVSGETLDYIKKSWEETYPEFTYSSRFFDEFIQGLYEKEEQYADLTRIFSLLAIFIACLGLLGLVSFMAVQRTKEIGLRKVMGATSSSILVLLSKEFTKWVVLANILAWPVAYYLMQSWLEDFAYRTEISLWVFLAGGLISLLIAWFTVSIKSYRASLSNPVDSIRTE